MPEDRKRGRKLAAYAACAAASAYWIRQVSDQRRDGP